MLKQSLATDDDRVIALLRVALGVVMFTHGAGKVLGWYGGPGISGAYGFMHGMLGIPTVFAYLAIFGEFFASLGLIFGLFGRLSAAGIFAIQLGALLLVHRHNGWFGGGKASIEYSTLTLPLALAIMIRGSGAWSIDRMLSKN